MTLAEASWTYQSPAEPKIVKLNDIVKVTVSVKSSMASLGKIDRKKTGHGALTLTNWIKFYGGNLGETAARTASRPTARLKSAATSITNSRQMATCRPRTR